MMTKTPRLRATASGMVHIVDPEGFVMHTVTIDSAREMKKRGEIEAAARPGYARLIPQPLIDTEETRLIRYKLAQKKEREKAERRGRRTKR